MSITPSDWIQLIIALIMLVSTISTSFLTYWLIRNNTLLYKTQFFSQICREERDIRKQIEEYDQKITRSKNKKNENELWTISDTLEFEFYEYVAILFFNNKIDVDMFYEYFINKIIYPYLDFMESNLFYNTQERIEEYPNLCKLFNSVFNLSIKNVPEDLKKLI